MRRALIGLLLMATGRPAVPQPPASASELTLVKTVPLEAPAGHVQGIALAGDRLWVTAVDNSQRKGHLLEFSLATQALKRRIEISRAERFHPGGMTADRDSLWIPVAEYRRDSSSVVQERDTGTLDLKSEFEVRDHIGCIAAAPDAIIGGNWDSRQFYFWDRKGRELRRVPNPTENAYQDMKFRDGRLVASGLLRDGSGAIDWLEYPSLRLLRRVPVGRTDRGMSFTREGMTLAGDRLYLLPEDFPSRLFVFSLKP